MDEFYDLDFLKCSGPSSGPSLLDEGLLDWMNLPEGFGYTWPIDTDTTHPQSQQRNTSSDHQFRPHFNQGDRIDSSADPGWLHDDQYQEMSASAQWPLAETFPPSTSAAITERGVSPESIQAEQRESKPDIIRCLYICAKCGLGKPTVSSLDKHSRESSHQVYACAVCSSSFRWSWMLSSHNRTAGHNSHACAVDSCNFTAQLAYEIEMHQRSAHVDFLKSYWALEYSCHQCGDTFSTRNGLTRHATDSQHTAFVCEHPGCLSTFTRYPDLTRHKDIHAAYSSRYPCTLCKRHRGPTAFKRKDHLTQHLRNYHHVDPSDGKSSGFTCPKEGCENYRDETFFKKGYASGWKLVPKWNPEKGDAPFRTQSALTMHLKKDHDESPFPCEVPFCDRVRGKGFTRKHDLCKHREAKHPDYQGESTSS